MAVEDRPPATATAGSRTTGARRLLLFLYVWLMVGFATGTLVLVGPAQWVIGALRGGRWANTESYAMWGVMALFVVGSFLLSLWLVRRIGEARRSWVRVGIPAAATALALLALAGWRNPAVLAAVAGGEEEAVTAASGAEFLFGAYPDKERLAELRAQGFTAVVSLQHPAVVPIEPQGIAAEKKAAREVGIRFIHAPMLPWVSDNEAALDTIRTLVERGEGKYYVHCGLGRDRANIVKAMVERMGRARVAAAPELKTARSFADRVGEGRFLMERGNFQVLEDSLWLVPWPNEKEGFSKIFAGQIEHITVLMDARRPEERAWMEEARRQFELYGVPHRVVAFDAGGVAEVARAVHAGPRPALVMVPRTAPCPGHDVARAFMAAFHAAGGPAPATVQPGDGDPAAEGRPLPCETEGAG